MEKNFSDYDFKRGDRQGFVIEYRGNFKEQIDKIDYAFGYPITDTLAIGAVEMSKLPQLLKDVPAIKFIEAKNRYTLQEISAIDTANINQVKNNPYLGLDGSDVLIGMVDTGVEYMNREFWREDDTSRIIELWDQGAEHKGQDVYIGAIYTNEEINKAIEVSKTGGDPYSIVPTRDTIGHGTKMASIIGARGYNKSIKGIANNCEFLVVKLWPSEASQMRLEKNGVPYTEAYNNTELLSAVEYLNKAADKLRKPIVIYIGLGGNQGAHDGYNITSRYLSRLGTNVGRVIVVGTGNFASDELHTTKYVVSKGMTEKTELVIPRTIPLFDVYIWVQKPNRMFLNITSPSGESTRFTKSKLRGKAVRRFYLNNTDVTILTYDPESYTGHQLFALNFRNIKSGIWTFSLKGEYITNGRYDIWLDDKRLLPEGVKLLEATPNNTLVIPSTSKSVVSVGYYDEKTKAISKNSGRGFDTNGVENPDIAAVGVAVLATSGIDEIETVTGSSVAAAITAGTSALILQWGIVDRNEITLSSVKMKSLLSYGAERNNMIKYPNSEEGYGKLDLNGTLNSISGEYRNENTFEEIEYNIGNLYIRLNKNQLNMEENNGG